MITGELFFKKKELKILDSFVLKLNIQYFVFYLSPDHNALRKKIKISKIKGPKSKQFPKIEN
jgi:hypothetical protein